MHCGTAFIGIVNEEESAAPMLVRDVYEVLSSHRPIVRRQQKFLQVQNVNNQQKGTQTASPSISRKRKECRQQVQASAENNLRLIYLDEQSIAVQLETMEQPSWRVLNPQYFPPGGASKEPVDRLLHCKLNICIFLSIIPQKRKFKTDYQFTNTNA
ncbi:hypothetical protein C0J52_14603 [Blattella germanica]|nr:hypothetical protein C0J52_14603 [Blattella germanica]